MGVPATPGRRKKFRRKLQGKFVSARTPVHLQGEQDIFADLEAHLVLLDLDRILRVTIKKVVNFFRKSAPPRQNSIPGYAYV